MKKETVWNFKTSPHHLFDYLLWPIIKLVWEPFSVKRSHWWHWKENTQETFNPLSTPRDASAHERHTNLWQELIQGNFLWKNVVIVEPIEYTGQYKIAFKSEEEKKNQICSVLAQGKIALLLGAHDTRFFAYTHPENKPLQLRVVGYTDKYRLNKEIRLL